MQRANAHCWARAFEWVGNARDARSLRGTCERGVMGFDVAVQGGWIALAAHRGRGEEEDAGATCMYVRGWFPVELRECKGLEGKGCIVRAERHRRRAQASGIRWPVEHLVVCETLGSDDPGRGDGHSWPMEAAVVTDRLEFRSLPDAPELQLSPGLLTGASETLKVLDFRKAPRVCGEMEKGFLAFSRTVEEVYLPNLATLPVDFARQAGRLRIVDFSAASNTRSIGHLSFFSCAALLRIDLRPMRSLRSIGEYVGSVCASLTDVDLSDLAELEYIGSEFSNGGPSLRRVSMRGLPRLTFVGEHAFASCPALEFIDIGQCPVLPKTSNFFGSGAASLTTIHLDGLAGLRKIDHGFLSGAISLRRIDFSGIAGVVHLGGAFLSQCESLDGIDLSVLTQLESVAEGAFRQCTKLRKLRVDGLAHLRTIGSGLCRGATSLEAVSLRGLAALKGSVGDGWFEGSGKLGLVDLSGSCDGVDDVAKTFLLHSGSQESPAAVTVIGATGAVAAHASAVAHVKLAEA